MTLKDINTLTTEEKLVLEYDQLLESRMFWEFYPELSGYYKINRPDFIRNKVNNMKVGIHLRQMDYNQVKNWNVYEYLFNLERELFYIDNPFILKTITGKLV